MFKKRLVRKTVYLGILVSVVLVIAPALAFAGGTGPQNGAGQTATNIKIERGELDLKNHEAKLSLSALETGDGTRGVSGTLALEKKYLLGGTVTDTGSEGVMLNPGLRLRADYLEKTQAGDPKLRRLDVELSGIAAFRVHAHNAEASKVLTPDLSNYPEIKNAKISDEWSCHYLEAYQGSAERAGCYKGLPPKDKWTEADQDTFDRRKVPVYVLDVMLKPSVAGEVVFLQATGVFEQHSAVDALNIGVKLNAVSLAGQAAFRMGGVQLDFCGQAAVGMNLGYSKIAGSRAAAALTTRIGGCAGMKLGELGRAGYNYDLAVQANVDDEQGDAVWTQQAHSVSMSQILTTPLQVGYTYEDERTSRENFGGKSIDTHLITVGGAF